MDRLEPTCVTMRTRTLPYDFVSEVTGIKARLYPFLENGRKVELQVHCLCQLVRAAGNPDIELERLTLSGPVPIFGISVRSHDMQECHRLAVNTTALSLGPAFTRSVRNG